MAIKILGITHWSIPVNNLQESEEFYGGLLGLTLLGRLTSGTMTCYNVGDHNILLCERSKPGEPEPRVHHSLTVSPETLVEACKIFREKKVDVIGLTYRRKGTFIGRELYFNDPSGNRLELRDPTWHDGMPEPSYDELVAS